MKNLFAALLSVAMVSGCSPSGHTQKQVQGSLLSFEDFDLETVVSMVKQDKVKGADELEKFINNSDNGVSNVDADKDGKIDYIRVIEGRDGTTITLDMVATPSSGTGEELTVANLRFNHNTTSNEMVVEGGYPTYVSGYNNHFYSYRHRHGSMSTGQALFLMWLMTPSRSMYMHPVPMYTPRAIHSRSDLSSRRATTRKTTKVSPVPKSTRPSTYSVKSAQKTKSRLKVKQAAAFKKREAAKTKQRATGFGSKSKTKVKSPSRKSSGWGRSSRPSRSRGGRRRSSLNYKTEISELNSGLEVVQNLKPVTWKWKNEDNTIKVSAPRVGFIAEDVAKLMPELTYSDTNGVIEGVNYDLIVVPLVNAVKSQQLQIKQLSNDLEKLKNSGTMQGGFCQP